MGLDINRKSKNVLHMLLRREVVNKGRLKICGRKDVNGNVEVALRSWMETDFLLHSVSAKYCSLSPPPRSTIAVAYSPDGKLIASTQ